MAIKLKGKPKRIRKALLSSLICCVLFIIVAVNTPTTQTTQTASNKTEKQTTPKKEKPKISAEEQARLDVEKKKAEEKAKVETQKKKEAEEKAKQEAAKKKAEDEKRKQEEAKKKAEEEAKKKAQKKEAEEKAKFDEWVKRQFSAWDGSHRELVKLVKENMNDAKSFEHMETRYSVDGRKGIKVYMKFRGANAFGAKIINTVEAYANYKDNTITITKNN
ncbi:hypothetical protein LAV60_15415 [Clostridium sporogenes]|uniref:hypothetical protein n=1 Tax=Clostridium sporogenes TaxID=1509 RepID=UPI0022377C9B|nr:hypothetical protein [Clostridium sporogenes]MCW6094559.1 hypothetical protein [Clostridium sporogenes]